MARIIICYAFKGSGHHAAALAVQAALREADPACSCELLDFFRCLYPHAGPALEAFYLGVVKAVPTLWQVLYDGPLAGSLATGWRRTGGWRCRRLRNALAKLRPDVVICTQASPFLFLNGNPSYDGGVSRPRLVGVVTDFVPHRLWAARGEGAVVVPSPQAAERLRAHGVGAARLHVLGIPIRPGLAGGARAEHAGPERVVLVMGGGFGLHLSEAIIRRIDASPEPFRLQVVAGRNESFRKALERSRRSFRHPLEVEGYVEDVPERMRRAEVLVSKPGGITSAEALATGLPMVLLPPLPGQERNNQDFLAGAGVAVPAEPGRAGEAVTRLLADPACLAAMRSRMAALARPEAARSIARLALEG